MAAKLLSLCVSIGMLTCLSGCFRYVLNDRLERADARVPVDDDDPVSTVEWSTIWGGSIPVWEPLRCVYEDGSVRQILDEEKDPNCKVNKRICQKGIGRTEVSLLGYSVPLAILTLGFAMPAKITLYCSTASDPDAEPHGP